MINIILVSISRYVVIAGVLGVLGFTISIPHSILITIGLIGVEINKDDESYTTIYFNTEQEKE